MTYQKITVIGGNLFQIAMAQLGDATQAARIASLNGITDPMLNGQVTLLIPPADPTQAGNGLWPQ